MAPGAGGVPVPLNVIFSWTVSVVVNDVAGKSIVVVRLVVVMVELLRVGEPNVGDEFAVVNVMLTPVGRPANVSRICVPFGVWPRDCVDDCTDVRQAEANPSAMTNVPLGSLAVPVVRIVPVPALAPVREPIAMLPIPAPTALITLALLDVKNQLLAELLSDKAASTGAVRPFASMRAPTTRKEPLVPAACVTQPVFGAAGGGWQPGKVISMIPAA